MNEHLSLLDIVLDYLTEHGVHEDFLDWAEMHNFDREELDERIENRYKNL